MYTHARLDPNERKREARRFLAEFQFQRLTRDGWETEYERWAGHLLPGDWHRVRQIVEGELRVEPKKAA